MSKYNNKIEDALRKLGKDYNFREDQIKTLRLEENEYTVMVEDDGFKKQICFYT